MSSYIDPSFICKNETIIMGLSGGPDSVFLLYQLVELQKNIPFTIVAAHLNHEWRTTAIRDQEFCKSLCASLNITFITKKISELDAPIYKNRSQEAQGRYYRKYFLQSVMRQNNAHKIFLAHHQNDQVETFFIKLIRGSSFEGLVSLKSINPPYYRPLLKISKSTILEYLTTNHISYVEDETNNDLSFLRNALRHKLLPILTDIDNRSENNIVKAIYSIQEANDYLDTHLDSIYDSMISSNILQLNHWENAPLFIQKKILLKWLYNNKCEFVASTSFVHEMLRFLSQPQDASHALTSSWKIIKKQSNVTLVHL